LIPLDFLSLRRQTPPVLPLSGEERWIYRRANNKAIHALDELLTPRVKL
jgi:hypothetical protein